jgi:hypothetical protein
MHNPVIQRLAFSTWLNPALSHKPMALCIVIATYRDGFNDD